MPDSKEIERGKRLRRIRDQLGISQEDFAKSLGITRGHLSQIENGKRNISYSIISNLAENLPIINLNHLLLGKGETFSIKDKQIGSVVEETTPNFRHLIPEKRHLTRSSRGRNILVRIEDQEGYCQGWNEEYLEEKAVRIYIPRIDKEARTFIITGTSMLPILYDGDWVIAVEAAINEIEDGAIYAIVCKSLGINIKYIVAEKEGLLLISANQQEYRPFLVHYKEIREVWKVVLRLTSHVATLPTGAQEETVEHRLARLEAILEKIFPDLKDDTLL